MKQIRLVVLVMVIVSVMVSVALAQETECWIGCQEPCVQDIRLISRGESSVIVIYIQTPFDEGMYDIRWGVFSLKGKKVRGGGTAGWYVRPHEANHFVFEQSIKLLQQDEYYVRAVVKKFSQPTQNER